MNSFSKCASAMAAVVLLAGVASGADAISSGKVKGVHSEKKEFVLTDAVTSKLSRDHPRCVSDQAEQRRVEIRGGEQLS